MLKYRANTGVGVSQTNVMQIAEGAMTEIARVEKQYRLTIDPLGTITSIKTKDRNGIDVVTAVSGITNRQTLREAFVKAINAAGGMLVDGGLEVSLSGSAYTIIGTGDVPLISLENGATRTFTAYTTKAFNTKLKFLLPYGEDATITVNGTTTALGDITAATDPADIKSDVDTATGKVSTVTHNPGLGGFIVEFTTASTVAVFINGTAAYQSDNTPYYTA